MWVKPLVRSMIRGLHRADAQVREVSLTPDPAHASAQVEAVARGVAQFVHLDLMLGLTTRAAAGQRMLVGLPEPAVGRDTTRSVRNLRLVGKDDDAIRLWLRRFGHADADVSRALAATPA